MVAGIIVAIALTVSGAMAFSLRTHADALRPRSVVSNFGQAAELDGANSLSQSAIVAIASPREGAGYWAINANGRVYAFGSVQNYGSITYSSRVRDAVDITATPTGLGYWIMTSNGNIYTFGDAQYFGTASTSGVTNETFVAVVPSESGNGYSLINKNGTVISFGDAITYGEAQSQLGGDTVADAQATPTGLGYVMVSAKGAVFTFGDAIFNGSATPGMLSQDAVAIRFTADGQGYWMLAADGGVFTFGNAPFLGSGVDKKLPGKWVDFAPYYGGQGYWIANGQVTPKASAAQPAVVAPGVINADLSDVWARLRNCESHGNYQTNTGNGYYGAYQFSAGTWNSMNTGYERADLAPPEVQDDAARRLQIRGGWGQWPVCSRKAGAR
jgi:hypothetical protein